eukprot:9456783-Pyramimonas_sp.AAC.1
MVELGDRRDDARGWAPTARARRPGNRRRGAVGDVPGAKFARPAAHLRMLPRLGKQPPRRADPELADGGGQLAALMPA